MERLIAELKFLEAGLQVARLEDRICEPFTSRLHELILIPMLQKPIHRLGDYSHATLGFPGVATRHSEKYLGPNSSFASSCKFMHKQENQRSND